MALRRRAPRHPGGERSQPERGTVGQHVPGVGEERERSGPPAACRLDEGESNGGERRDEQRRAGAGRLGVRMLVVVVVVVLSHAASPAHPAPPRRSRRATPAPGRGGSTQSRPHRARAARRA